MNACARALNKVGNELQPSLDRLRFSIIISFLIIILVHVSLKPMHSCSCGNHVPVWDTIYARLFVKLGASVKI